jgi:hypothetical protein
MPSESAFALPPSSPNIDTIRFRSTTRTCSFDVTSASALKSDESVAYAALIAASFLVGA